MRRCNIFWNFGGGVYIDNWWNWNWKVELLECNIFDNYLQCCNDAFEMEYRAGDQAFGFSGAGLYISKGIFDITNCNIFGNFQYVGVSPHWRKDTIYGTVSNINCCTGTHGDRIENYLNTTVSLPNNR